MGHQARQRNTDDDSADGLVDWRRRRLERAGFEARLAQALATDQRIDLHAVLDLIDRGCPPHLAARILAPLEQPRQEWS